MSKSARQPATRYGGEEIVLLLPETDSTGAAQVAERARRLVEELEIEHQLEQKGRQVVTISIGVATVIPQRGQRREMLVELADGMLYEAKDAGRNQVHTVTEESI